MKNKRNGGFSLVEVLVSITVLALVVIPICSGIILSFRMNAKTDSLMQAQLAVSSTVETLMAEGIPNNTGEDPDYGKNSETDRFPEVTVQVTPKEGIYYSVTVTSDTEDSVSVTTSIRAVPEKAVTE